MLLKLEYFYGPIKHIISNENKWNPLCVSVSHNKTRDKNLYQPLKWSRQEGGKRLLKWNGLQLNMLCWGFCRLINYSVDSGTFYCSKTKMICLLNSQGRGEKIRRRNYSIGLTRI